MKINRENKMKNIVHSTHFIQSSQGQVYAEQWHVADSQHAPIILLHDSLGCVALWRDFPLRLAQCTERTVIAYDRVGFGQSFKQKQMIDPDFVRLEAKTTFQLVRDFFQILDFVVLGHSVGGGMALCCAAQYPQDCRAVITIAAQAFNEVQTIAGIKEAQIAFQNAEQFQRLEKYHAEKTQWVLDAWIKTWLAPIFENWNMDQMVRKVVSPSLIMHGEFDEYGSLAHPHRFQALLGDRAQVEILKDCYHTPHKEQPQLVLNLIVEFLNQSVDKSF